MPLILFRNEAYDKFYIVNYLEFGKTWSGARKAGRTNDDFDDELPTGFENETGKSHIPSICKISSGFPVLGFFYILVVHFRLGRRR